MLKRESIRYVSFMMGIAIILSLFFAIRPALAINQDQNRQMAKAADVKSEIVEKETFKRELSHDQIVSLTDRFMDMLVQETDEMNQVIHFDSKRALLEEFETITTKEVASEYVQYYFHETSDGLYLKPTETPPWFQEHHDYDMIQKDYNTMKVVQENTTDLYGTYTVRFEFTWYNGQWRIADINHT
ncbi:hypothetical protein SAMN04488072_103263 [Lentibacillus halodurans]|uniref:DUF3993 domain-containing protein n=1 Tax=Lentibacillus halodurans TaxID=237679 RepID=A0A1I0WVA5_9BACI|nr:hypothetical protein [Lentibacillus halodurans]SFA91873.1 hypothetical protein SAMN04488072_103263 [Lentibacillus halodurans]